nr:acyl-CoA-binding protein [Monascus ruber]
MSVDISNYLSGIDPAFEGKFGPKLQGLATPIHDKKDALKAVVEEALGLVGTQEIADEEESALLAAGFQFATELIQQLTKKPSDLELLDPWAHYKHGTKQGGPKDAGLPFSATRHKYNRYQAIKDTSFQKSQAEYIKLVNALVAKYQLKS